MRCLLRTKDGLIVVEAVTIEMVSRTTNNDLTINEVYVHMPYKFGSYVSDDMALISFDYENKINEAFTNGIVDLSDYHWEKIKKVV